MSFSVGTERVRLRRFESSDLNDLHRLDGDPVVMKYISGGIPATREEALEALGRILAQYDEWTSFGIWAAELKANQEFMGWFCLKPLRGRERDIELGYRLLTPY